MKIKLSKDDLLFGIQTVENVVASKTTLPILSNILLETNRKNLLKLNATDLDLGISCEIPVNIEEEGAVTIPAKRFSDIIKEMPFGDIMIYVKKNNQIDIEGEKCRFKLIGLPKDEFPKFPDFKDKEGIVIEQGILKEMLRMTAFAVSHEESRYVLNGLLIEISGDNICIVATDGRRLAKMNKKLKESANKEVKVILPGKAVQEIMRNLKEQGRVILFIGTNQVLLDIDGVLIASRIIEGEFPNYDQVIPKGANQKIKINTQILLSAIRRANLLSTPEFQAVKFEVFKDKIVVSKTTPEIGESREEVLIDYGGPEIMAGFNPHFLIDVLKNISQEFIDAELAGSDKPMIIHLPDYLYLTLPMRL